MNFFTRLSLTLASNKKEKPMEHSKHCYEFLGLDNIGSSCSSASSQSSFLSFRFKNDGDSKLPYKKRFGACCRRAECEHFYKNYDNKVLVVIERFTNEKRLPELDRDLFVLPYKMTVGQLQNVLKKQMQLSLRHSGMILLVNGCEIPPLHATVAELAHKFLDDDGLLYIAYANDDAYG